MSLWVRVTAPPEKTCDKFDKTFTPRLGVEGRCCSMAISSMASIPTAASSPARRQRLTIPCDGILDESGGDVDLALTIEKEIMEKAKHSIELPTVSIEAVWSSFCRSVAQEAMRRRNILVINRGAQFAGKTDFCAEHLIGAVLSAVSPVTERALQLVADEAAKERQMQRLLRNEEEVPGMAAAAPDSAAPRKLSMDSPQSQRDKIDFAKSKAVTALAGLRIPPIKGAGAASFQPHRPFTARATASRGSSPRPFNSRFLLLNAASNDPIELPEHPNMLTARGFSPNLTRERVSIVEPSASSTHRHNRPTAPRQAPQNQLARRNSIRFLETIHINPEDARPAVYPNNGWKTSTEFTYMQFNGQTSFISLPGVPSMETFIRNFVIDFWIQTDFRAREGRCTLFYIGEGQRTEVGMQLHVGLHWYADAEDCLWMFIRDSGNRVLEVVLLLQDVEWCDDHFHHFTIRVRNIEETHVEILLDGELQDRMRYLQSEHPSTFNQWPHRIFVGGILDEENNVQNPFRGALRELRFSKYLTKQTMSPQLRWSFGRSSVPVEIMGRIPPDSVSIVKDVQLFSTPEFPVVCPLFDGKLIVNLGSLGPFGIFMHHFGIDVRFRTTVTSRMMSLIGVTDSQQKMVELGIVLNAEPSLGPEKMKYKEYHVTVFLSDLNGKWLSGIVRFNERKNLLDGQWHTFSWKVVDAESNKMEVRVDGVVHEVLLALRDGPKAFTPLRDWVAIGAHSIRSWKIKNVFTGAIQSCSVSVRGETLCQYKFDEGPGASIAVDQSGHFIHGLYTNPETVQMRKHDISWIPIFEKPLSQLLPDEEELIADTLFFRNNKVRYALLCFTGEIVEGRAVERVFDALHNNAAVELTLEQSIFDVRRRTNESRQFFEIPDCCFVDVESQLAAQDDVRRLFKQAAHSGESKHLLFVLAIGDCRVSVLDLWGPRIPPMAIYDSRTLKWKGAIATAGNANKMTMLLNSMTSALDRALLEVSAFPQILHRLPLCNVPEKATAPGLVSALEYQGLPWRLAATIHSLMLNIECGSKLHTWHSLWSPCSANEAAAMIDFQAGIVAAAYKFSVIMIQRNWRANLGRRMAHKLHLRMEERRRCIENIDSLREEKPHFRPKTARRALLITLFKFNTSAIPKIALPEAEDVAGGLEEQGYVVETIDGLNRRALINKLESISDSEMTFVYIAGYGGRVHLRYPTFPMARRLAFSVNEDRARYELVNSMMPKYWQLRMACITGAAALFAEQQALKNAGKKQKKQSKAQQQAAQIAAQVAEENHRRACAELVQEESEQRAVAHHDITHESSQLMYEFRRIHKALLDFEERYLDGVDVVFTSDNRSAHPTLETITLIDQVISVVLKKPRAPEGYQCVLALDLLPLPSLCSGYSVLCSSTGQCLRFPQNPYQHGILTWHLRKALQGNHIPLPKVRRKDTVLYGGVDCDQSRRDWRSFARYVGGKIARATGSTQALEILEAEIPYTADVVPIVKMRLPLEVRQQLKAEKAMRRVTGAITISVDSFRVSPDLMSELRSCFPGFDIVELAVHSHLLAVFANANMGLDRLPVGHLHAEVLKCSPSGSTIECRVDAEGLHVEVGGERSKAASTLSAIASRAHNWQLAHASMRTVLELHHTETFFSVHGMTNAQRWRTILRRRCQAPVVANGIRIVDCSLEQD